MKRNIPLIFGILLLLSAGMSYIEINSVSFDKDIYYHDEIALLTVQISNKGSNSENVIFRAQFNNEVKESSVPSQIFPKESLTRQIPITVPSSENDTITWRVYILDTMFGFINSTEINMTLTKQKYDFGFSIKENQTIKTNFQLSKEKESTLSLNLENLGNIEDEYSIELSGFQTKNIYNVSVKSGSLYIENISLTSGDNYSGIYPFSAKVCSTGLNSCKNYNYTVEILESGSITAESFMTYEDNKIILDLENFYNSKKDLDITFNNKTTRYILDKNEKKRFIFDFVPNSTLSVSNNKVSLLEKEFEELKEEVLESIDGWILLLILLVSIPTIIFLVFFKNKKKKSIYDFWR